MRQGLSRISSTCMGKSLKIYLKDRRRGEKTSCCHLHTYRSKANPVGFSLLVWREVITAGRLKNVGSFCLYSVLTQISRWSQPWAAESGASFFFFPAINIRVGSTMSEVSWATILLTLGSSIVSTMKKTIIFENIGRGKHGDLTVKELKGTHWFLRDQKQGLPESDIGWMW